MKILKQGITTFRAKCPICGCEFEYEREDIESEYNIWRRVKCPCCGELITHKETPEKIDITYDSISDESNTLVQPEAVQKESDKEFITRKVSERVDELLSAGFDPFAKGGPKGLYDDVKCPHCGAKDFILGGSTCTLMYCQTRIKDGKVVENTDRNIHTTECTCNKCGKRFKLVNGKVEK